MVVSTPTTHTPDDLLKMADGDRFELINGQLVERNVSALSSFVAGKIYARLNSFIEERSTAGWVFPDNTSFQIFRDDPTKVRKVDAAFISSTRSSIEQLQEQGHITIAPDIVVEVISANDLAYDVNRKIEEWLAAGVRLVWVIDPEIRILQAYAAEGSVRKYGVSDMLQADDVLPGFATPMVSLFP
jgi:Uma2 family endonuclease